MSAIIPQPRCPITTRPATPGDLPFIDALQKKHARQVGWFPTKTIEGKIKAGHVLVAEELMIDECGMMNEEKSGPASSSFSIHHSSIRNSPTPVGYLIGADQYFKRDDVGIIYQINVAEGKRRALVGAALLKAQFERSAYGCKLYCCWCAQDIEANHFWEALGFQPLAFRAGSEKKQRIHIFWCKRIRQGDTSAPWWFPSETKGGSMMEDRLVFPIPPGTHWSDAKPIVLPRHTHGGQSAEPKQLEDGGTRRAKAKVIKPALAAITQRQPLGGGLRFQSPELAAAKPEPPKRQRKAKVRNDPKFVSAARELRDRWLERVNADPAALLVAEGKYDVSRALAAPAAAGAGPMLVAAAPARPTLALPAPADVAAAA